MGELSPEVHDVLEGILRAHDILDHVVDALIKRDVPDADNLLLFIIHHAYHEFLANVLTAIDSKELLMRQLALMTLGGKNIDDAAEQISEMLIRR